MNASNYVQTITKGSHERHSRRSKTLYPPSSFTRRCLYIKHTQRQYEIQNGRLEVQGPRLPARGSLLSFPSLSSPPFNTLPPLPGLPPPSQHTPRMLPSEFRRWVGPRPEGTGTVSEQGVLVRASSKVLISPPLPPVMRSIHHCSLVRDPAFRRFGG